MFLRGGDCCLPLGVSALACAIAREVPDTNDLLLLAAVLTQLGDTLALIAARQAACPSSFSQDSKEPFEKGAALRSAPFLSASGGQNDARSARSVFPDVHAAGENDLYSIRRLGGELCEA